MKRITMILAVSALSMISAQGQGFVNLNFESVRLILFKNPPAAGDWIATSNALPGWSVSVGTNQLSVIPYNAPYLPGPQLLETNKYVLAGNFDVLLGGSTISISQTGLVPSDTKSLTFDAYFPLQTSLLVSLGGQNLSYMVISNALNSYGQSYSVCAADISGFVGQVKTLTFSGGTWLDDIQFSPEAVPEPPASLILLGGGLLFYVRERSKRVLSKRWRSDWRGRAL